jgi:membrane protein implicated in regulation of membrane protease activity
MLRVRLETILVLILAVLTGATLLWPTWIELLTGATPDLGSGDAEWGLVLVFAVSTVALAALAARDHRIVVHRARAARNADG